MSDLHLEARTEDGKVQRWPVDEDKVLVGRGDGGGGNGRIAVSGDPMLSRMHFHIVRGEGKATISRDPKARNPLFFMGKQEDCFELKPGQTFVTGKTRFSLTATRSYSHAPVTEYTMLRTDLHEVQRENSAASFRTLLALLPKLRGVRSGGAFKRALEVLSALLPQAREVKILRMADPFEQLMEWCKNDGPSTPASKRLVQSAQSAEATVAHVWALEEESELQATAYAQADWAIASPVVVSEDERYCLYAVGNSTMALTDTEVREQKKTLDELAALLDIVAETLSHHLTTERMNRFEGQVGQFFSPGLRERLTDREFSEVLKPRLREVTVMFFDLRGFSKATESAEDETLEKILSHHEVLTRVMTEVTEAVFRQGGLVIDYQGDAVLACWGALSSDSEVQHAAEAARDICRLIRELEVPFGGQKLACGIGMATGKAVAGQIGAKEQIKFGVLGKVVNLASRLEGLTKYFGVPILVNQAFRDALPQDFLCRFVGRVRPAGLTQHEDIHEIVVAAAAGGSGLDSERVKLFERTSKKMLTGSPDEVKAELAGLPEDSVRNFLLSKLEEQVANDVTWDGVLAFGQK